MPRDGAFFSIANTESAAAEAIANKRERRLGMMLGLYEIMDEAVETKC